MQLAKYLQERRERSIRFFKWRLDYGYGCGCHGVLLVLSYTQFAYPLTPFLKKHRF
jgi:hypothetical protein